MITRITSNGSKWVGEAPDSIEDLIVVLGEYALDRTFEEYGNFVSLRDLDDLLDQSSDNRAKYAGMTHFFGNFFALSHVFNIDTNDPAIIDRLTSAIRANQQRPDYLSQETPKERKAREEAVYQAKMQALKAKCEAEARAVLGLTEPHT